MRSGVEVIYQAALVAPPWLGYADFLERVEEPSAFGAWSYEPVDTKLARSPRAEHVVQLATYSGLLRIEQGILPSRMHLVLGNNTRISVRAADFVHYQRIAQQQLEAFAADPPPGSNAEPCGHCKVCRWIEHCEAEWDAVEHLTLVANITKNQRARLCDVGITTLRLLAGLPTDARIPRLQAETVTRLQVVFSLPGVTVIVVLANAVTKGRFSPGLKKHWRERP